MNIQMDDADDDPRDLNELTNESTKSMIISNSQGVERDFLPNIKTIKKQFLPFSQEEVRSTELCCAIDSSQINQDFNDIYSEFPEVIMYRSYIYKKCGIMTMAVGKDTSILYKCSDNQRISCNSRVKYYLNSKVAKLIVDHSKPNEQHKFSVICKSPKNQNICSLKELDRQKVTKIICQHLSKNKDATSTEIMNNFKLEFGDSFTISNEVRICNIISDVSKCFYSKQMQDAKDEMTMTSEIFGREPCRFYNKILNQPEHALIFYSQFQEYIINQNQTMQNFQIEVMEKCAPRGYKAVLIIQIFDALTNCFYPVFFSILQSKTNTSYTEVLTRFKRSFGDKINPKIICTPFDASLLTAAKVVFQEAKVMSCFFHFVKVLWKNATKLKLKKKNLLKMTRKLIHAIKSFSLINPKSVDEKYSALKRKVLNNFLNLCPRYEHLFRYIERCFILTETEDGVKRGFANMFPIPFWNFQWIRKNTKMNIIINYGAEDFTKLQSRYFAFSNAELDQVISAFQDLEATKRIEFEDKPRDIQAVDENSIEPGEDIAKWEKRVGHETSYCVRFLKNDDSIRKMSIYENSLFYVSEDEFITKEDEEDEPPISKEKKIEASKDVPIVCSEISSDIKSKSITKVKIVEMIKQNKKKSKDSEKDDDKKQKTEELEESNVKTVKKMGIKDRTSSSENLSNQNTLKSYPTINREEIQIRHNADPKNECLINESMTIEEILKKLDIVEYLPIFQENKITSQNLKFLEISDLRDLKIPIGPARQIVSEFALMANSKNVFVPKSSNLDRFKCNQEFRRSSSNEKETFKATALLPIKRRGPQKSKPVEIPEERREKDDKRRKRDDKLKEKDKTFDDRIKDRIDVPGKDSELYSSGSERKEYNKIAKLTDETDPNFGSMMKHLVKIEPNQRTCPKLSETKEKEDITNEMASVVNAKPLDLVVKEEVKEEICEECETSQDTLNSDEPFL